MTYFLCAKNAFLSNTTYRFNAFFSTLSMLIGVYVEIAIWQALYAGTSGTVGTSYGDIALQDMVSYVIISTVVRILVGNQIILLIDQKIKSGDIAFDINRPFSFFGYLFANTLGNNLYRFLFQFLFVAVFILPFFSVSLPKLGSFLLFLVAVALGMVIHFIMAFTLGVLGFWYIRIWHMARLLSISIGFFSGSFVPIWFFPAVLGQIGQFLPFQYIYFIPISIYLEKLTVSQGLVGCAVQLLWIGILSLVAYLVWHKGIKQLVIQGG